MRKFIDNWADSFKPGDSGHLRRKWMAFFGMIFAAYISVRYGTSTNVIELVSLWLLYAALCIGLVTFEQVVKLKNGGNTNSNTNES